MNITSYASVSNQETKATYSKNAESLPHMQYAEKQLSDIRTKANEDKLTISRQALELFQQSETEPVDKLSVESTANDEAIENIKEQIEELKQQLNRIKNDRSEEAQRERKMLQYQINSLNASMMDLLGKKLNAI